MGISQGSILTRSMRERPSIVCGSCMEVVEYRSKKPYHCPHCGLTLRPPGPRCEVCGAEMLVESLSGMCGFCLVEQVEKI